MRRQHPSFRQPGISLVVVLLFLLIMTVLGITAVRTSNLEEKMSGNERDRELAFEAAEATLRDAERDIALNITASAAFANPCANGLCTPPVAGVSAVDSVNWMGAAPKVYGTGSGAAAYPVALARAPRYVIELMPDMPAPAGESLNQRSTVSGGTPFRITATAWGRKQSTQVQLQVVYVKR
jgi:type IV pilus assembly protein PilX